MGLYDRDYTRENFRSRFHGAPQMRMSFGNITPAVKWLLIINVSVFFMQILGADRYLVSLFAVYPHSFYMAQLWRLITYQFLHGGLRHILFNMLGVFFLGPTLERHWGTKKFLLFYLGCGAAGGLFYILLAALGFLQVVAMIGASGAVLGMLAACAILFPQFVVIFIIFPVPIRVAAIIIILIASVTVLSRGFNAGGEAAHLGGMAAGAVYVVSKSWRDRVRLKLRSGAWQKKKVSERELEQEVDRILQKVHNLGIHSLTSKEKKILKRATEAERMRNKF